MIEGLEIPQILPAVKGRQGPICQRAEKRKMEQVDVKMKYVEFLRALADPINHQHEVRNGVADGRIEAKCAVQEGANSALVTESPLAKSVTSWPILTSSSVK